MSEVSVVKNEKLIKEENEGSVRKRVHRRVSKYFDFFTGDICKVCAKKFKNLSASNAKRHVFRTHNKEYLRVFSNEVQRNVMKSEGSIEEQSCFSSANNKLNAAKRPSFSSENCTSYTTSVDFNLDKRTISEKIFNVKKECVLQNEEKTVSENICSKDFNNNDDVFLFPREYKYSVGDACNEPYFVTLDDLEYIVIDEYQHYTAKILEMAPSRDFKKNVATEALTSSLRPRKAIVVYNERQLQSHQQQLMRDEKRSTKASLQSNSNGNNNECDDGEENGRENSRRTLQNSARKRSNSCNEDHKLTTKRGRNLKVTNEVDVSQEKSTSPRRSSRNFMVPAAASSPKSIVENSNEVISNAVEEKLTGTPSLLFAANTNGKAAFKNNDQNISGSQNADKFGQTMESVLQGKHAYKQMSNSLSSSILNNTNSSLTNGHSAKPYVYRPRVSKALADENGIFATILKTAQNTPAAALLSSYKPRTYGANYNPTRSSSTFTPAVETSSSYTSNNNINIGNGGMTVGESLCATFASTSSSLAESMAQSQSMSQCTTLSAALATESSISFPSVSSTSSADSSLPPYYGGVTGAYPISNQPAPLYMSLNDGRKIAPNFTTSNPLLATSIPAKLEFVDLFRPYTACSDPAVMSRTTVDVRSLGKALFHDDTSWSRYTFPKRSLFGSECLVYFYHSLRWPDRKLVLVPFGKSVTSGEIPYTCGSCFKFSACLKHRFDLAPRNKIPVIVAKKGQLLDDPDNPLIPHICDPAQLSDAEKAALTEYGELMAGTRVAQTPPKDVTETSSEVSGEAERRNLLILVARLTECCTKLMSVGFDFTSATMREKAFEIADEMNLPRHCISEQWLQNVRKWLGIADPGEVASSTESLEVVAAAIFGDAAGPTVNQMIDAYGGGIARGANFAFSINIPTISHLAGDASATVSDGTEDGFTNANDYLQSMVSEAMSREDLQSATTSTEAKCAEDDVLQGESCDGVSVLVRESCPIEFIFDGGTGSMSTITNTDNDMASYLNYNTSIQLELEKSIKMETPDVYVDLTKSGKHSPRKNMTKAASVSGDENFSAHDSQQTERPRCGSSSILCDGVDNEKDNTSRKNTDSTMDSFVANKKTLYTVIQESFTKTNFPEVSNSLEVIRQHILQRDCSLMPMFENFSARIAKMMYTTKAKNAPNKSSINNNNCNGEANGCGSNLTENNSEENSNSSESSRDATQFSLGNGTSMKAAPVRVRVRQRHQPSAEEISAAFEGIKPMLRNEDE